MLMQCSSPQASASQTPAGLFSSFCSAAFRVLRNFSEDGQRRQQSCGALICYLAPRRGDSLALARNEKALVRPIPVNSPMTEP
jgi:hypothetical protein